MNAQEIELIAQELTALLPLVEQSLLTAIQVWQAIKNPQKTAS